MAKAKTDEPEKEAPDEAKAQAPVEKQEPKEATVIKEAAPSVMGSPTSTESLALKTGPDDPVMMFPRPVKLQHKGIMYSFDRGIHRVPKEISTHWYLGHNKVELWEK